MDKVSNDPGPLPLYSKLMVWVMAAGALFVAWAILQENTGPQRSAAEVQADLEVRRSEREASERAYVRGLFEEVAASQEAAERLAAELGPVEWQRRIGYHDGYQEALGIYADEYVPLLGPGYDPEFDWAYRAGFDAGRRDGLAQADALDQSRAEEALSN